ncbi:MAG: hypothetical protein QXD23_02395 [Candidatus Micrarchaeaceae archaeon]
MKNVLRLQSAMEYLMTYGWSILIISITLVILFVLGVFNNIGGGSNACIANSGFLCTNITLGSNYKGSPDTGHPYIGLDIGEIGQDWNNVYIIAVPDGQQITTAYGYTANSFYYWGQLVGYWGYLNNLNSGSEQYITTVIFDNSPLISSVKIGTKVSGTVYVMYSTSYTTNAITELGTFTVIASS